MKPTRRVPALVKGTRSRNLGWGQESYTSPEEGSEPELEAGGLKGSGWCYSGSESHGAPACSQ